MAQLLFLYLDSAESANVVVVAAAAASKLAAVSIVALVLLLGYSFAGLSCQSPRCRNIRLIS